MDAVVNIFEFFKAETVGADFATYKPVVKYGMECIHISNRYLTPKINIPDADHMQDSLKTIDPHNYLRDFAGDKFVHAEENVVQYYRMKTVIDKNLR